MIRRPTLLELLTVVVHARDDERAEYEAVRGVEWNPGKVAAEFYARTDAAMLALFNDAGTPVAVAGFIVKENNVFAGWMFSTADAWANHWRELTKAVRRTMDHLLDSGDARVIELRSTSDRTRAMRWYVRGLKMRYEGTLRARCSNGQGLAVYSRVGGMG